MDGAGAIYGTAAICGNLAACSFGCGVVFKLTPPTAPDAAWTYSVLHSFTGGSEGSGPMGKLTFDPMGALYGTTSDGGNTACVYGCGVVFKLTPPASSGGAWRERVLYKFTGGSDGVGPNASLTFDPAGALYGTTGSAGNLKCEPLFDRPARRRRVRRRRRSPSRVGPRQSRRASTRYGSSSFGSAPHPAGPTTSLMRCSVKARPTGCPL